MDTFSSHGTLKVGSKDYKIARLKALEKKGFAVSKLPYSIRVLLENLLRREDGVNITAQDIEALAQWKAKNVGEKEIAFMPSRVLMQDFTGVPAVVDLAAMRDAMKALGGDPKKINPLVPAELVIDHSVQVDFSGTPEALKQNATLEFERNHERYAFLRWGQKAFQNFKVVPPDTGIVHQVNLEYLARVVMPMDGWAYPDTVVGTDSHTTMVNGLGVLGWGVGGIEAEAAMLGQEVTMLIPEVIGMKLTGALPEGATATDLVLTVTQILRKRGVVGKFVEFFGPGAASLSLADRATIANMAPEYGATCGFFPVDEETLHYLQLTGRPQDQIDLVKAYLVEQGLFWTTQSADCDYTDVLELDLKTIVPSLAGPKRPQDRVPLTDVSKNFAEALPSLKVAKKEAKAVAPQVTHNGETFSLKDGAVVITAITSCTNTSNPSVLVAAGLLAKKAVAKGLKIKPWVKPSLAPGSQVVGDYLAKAGVLDALEALKFHIVGYGCTTCIGNSGPLAQPISQGIADGNLVVTSVLSGNRNFEGRVHPEVRANYLASPPLVVAYAIAGRVDLDLSKEPIGQDAQGKDVFLKDIWPSQKEIQDAVLQAVTADMFRRRYANVYAGDPSWQNLKVPDGDTYTWDDASTYVKNPPYFVGMSTTPAPVKEIAGASVLAVFGDSITTDHISPAGNIKASSPAGTYLQEHRVQPADFNSYGARRGNHEAMMRGTFANIRIKNLMLFNSEGGVEGGVTIHLPTKTQMPIYDASMKYQAAGTPLIILAGKEYGSGSSRDWAAKGPALLGVKAVIAESYERIHRSNLVGMGILPLEFPQGQNAASLGLTGTETFDIVGLKDALESGFKNGRQIQVIATGERTTAFTAKVRIDTPKEIDYYKNGGILPYVLRKLLKAS